MSLSVAIEKKRKCKGGKQSRSQTEGGDLPVGSSSCNSDTAPSEGNRDSQGKSGSPESLGTSGRLGSATQPAPPPLPPPHWCPMLMALGSARRGSELWQHANTTMPGLGKAVAVGMQP